jgi:hypothetical protein
MRRRRAVIIGISVAILAVVGLIALQTGPFAQPPAPPGAPGGAAPAGGGGGAFAWKEFPAPEQIARTYKEHIERTGPSTAQIPPAYLVDQEGKERLATDNEWFQLQRIYSASTEAAGDLEARKKKDLRPGVVGAHLVDPYDQLAAYHNSVSRALTDAYLAGQNLFTTEIGYPRLYSPDVLISPEGMVSGKIVLPVILRVKPSAQRTYGELVYRKLKPFDCLGFAEPRGYDVQNTSEPFNIITQKGGYYRPRAISLPVGTATKWAAAWAQNIIAVVLLDRNDDVVGFAAQPAKHGGEILGKIIAPDRIHYSPRYKVLIPPEGLRFEGGKWNISGTRGWIYEFTFTLPKDQMLRLHKARAYYGRPDQMVKVVEPKIYAAVASQILSGATGAPQGGGAGAGAPGAPPGGPGGPPPGGPPGGPGGPPPGGPPGAPPA